MKDIKILRISIGNLGISALNVFISTYIPLFLLLKRGSNSTIPLMVSAGFFTGIVVQPLSGMLSDYIRKLFGSRKVIILVFGTITGICIELIPRLYSTEQVYIVVFILFIAFHAYQIPLAAMIPDNICIADRKKASAYWSLAGMTGYMVIPLMAILFWNKNIRAFFDVLSVIIIITLSIPLIYTRENRINTVKPNNMNKEDLFKSIRGKAIADFYILKSCWWMAAGFIIPFFPNFMNEVFGITVVSISITIELAILLGMGTLIFFILHPECMGNKRLLLYLSMLFILSYSAIYTYFSSLTVIIAAMFLYGIIFAILTSIPLSILYEIMPKGREGLFLGLDNIFLNMPQAVSIGFAGLLYSAWGIRSIYLISGAFSTAVIILLRKFKSIK